MRASVRQAACLIASAVVLSGTVARCDEPLPHKVATDTARPRDRDRTTLRYAGRTFDDWRDQLLNDLDPQTRLQAMEPLTAFARKGYANEAVAALSEVLHDEPEAVVHGALNALASIGRPAIPVLIAALPDKRREVRIAAAQLLGQHGPDAVPAADVPATDALVKLLNDKDEQVRLAAVGSLAAIAGDNDGLKPVFERIAADHEAAVREAFVRGLGLRSPQKGWSLRLLIEAADDETASIRSAAGMALARHGPPDDAAIDALKRLLRDHDQQVWTNTLSSLFNADVAADSRAQAAVLADALVSAETLPRLRQNAVWAPDQQSFVSFEPIDILVKAHDQTELAVRTLVQIVEGKVEGWQPVDALYAIDALGRIGPEAKAAVPALEGWVFGDKRIEFPNGDSLEKHAGKAIRRIAGRAPSVSREQREPVSD